MTAQVNDHVNYDRADWALAGERGGKLFDPGEHGLAVVAGSTACYRGYACVYKVTGRSFHLQELLFACRGEPQSLFGRLPERVSSPGGLAWRLSELDLPVAFTGSLLLGRILIRNLVVNMGFHPAWKYATVVELDLVDGELRDATDRSRSFAAIRDQRVASGLRPGPDASEEERRTWVQATFSRKY